MTDNFEKDIDVPSKQIIIDGVDVSALYSDLIACMNRYEVAHLFIKTVEQLKRKEQECEELKIYIESNEQQVKEVETLVMDNDRLINELDNLKAEVINKTDTIEHIFRCLIKANYQGKLNDTIFINKFSTLFDYIAGALGIKETDEYVAMVLEDIEDDR